MKKTRLEQMKDALKPEFGTDITILMQKEYDKLVKEYENRPASFQSHLHNNIFPVVVAFRSMMALGVERSLAAKKADSYFLSLMEEPKKMIQNLMKIPGLYHCMPWLWKHLMPKMFSTDSGFRFRFYPTDSKQVKFDMLACPYHEMCKELDCVELAETFCATDDLCYGNMHPKLIWNRTKTMARGADVCDFDLYIKDKMK